MGAPRIFVAGHQGMVGSAILQRLQSVAPEAHLITRTRNQLDLTSQTHVKRFFSEQRIDQVYLAAAKVGGILANDTMPADFIRDNLCIQSNVIHAAYDHGVSRLLFLGSSCIYPRDTAQPITEEQLLTGVLESTNEPYAVAKIAGIKMCESYNRQYGTDYRSVMPTNLYGANDNFHPDESHVVPALIRRFHQSKVEGAPCVTVWGTGEARREFLHVDDMASACVHVMNVDAEVHAARTRPMCSHLNVGTGEEVTIRQLASIIAEVVGFVGSIEFDRSKPDGAPRKLLDVSRIRELGWKHHVNLRDGLNATYDWYLKHLPEG